MDKELIKTWLLNKKPRVYTIIVQCYFDKLSNLKTALFIEWLSIELGLPVESINKSSISSALRRYRILKKSEKFNSRVISTFKDEFETSFPDKISFR